MALQSIVLHKTEALFFKEVQLLEDAQMADVAALANSRGVSQVLSRLPSGAKKLWLLPRTLGFPWGAVWGSHVFKDSQILLMGPSAH